MPARVEKIGDWPFKDCSGIKLITLNNELAVEKFSKTFENTSKNIEEVIIADNVKTIKAESFKECGWVTAKFTIPNSVTTIESEAFLNCSGLTSIDIPETVTNIGENAFSGCTNINSIKINNAYVLGNFTSIFPNRTNLSMVILGNNVGDTIPANTFKECSNLNSVSIGDNIKSIGESAFSECVSLKSVSIPDKVNTINRLAFSDCRNLNDVTVYGNLSFVGDGAFSDCTKLNNFTYKGIVAPRHSKEIGVFANCPELDNVSVPNNYEGDDFCGYKIGLVRKTSWWKWLIGTIGVGEIIGIVTFIINFPNTWNNLIDGYCCCCGEWIQCCKLSVKNAPTNSHDQSSTVDPKPLIQHNNEVA